MVYSHKAAASMPPPSPPSAEAESAWRTGGGRKRFLKLVVPTGSVYQRRPPPPPGRPPPGRRAPPPPGRPPPPPRCSGGRASSTLIVRPSRLLPFSSSIALRASAAEAISTNPNPRERPEKRSATTDAESTLPACSKKVRRLSSVVSNERPPTYSFVATSILLLLSDLPSGANLPRLDSLPLRREMIRRGQRLLGVYALPLRLGKQLTDQAPGRRAFPDVSPNGCGRYIAASLLGGPLTLRQAQDERAATG